MTGPITSIELVFFCISLSAIVKNLRYLSVLFIEARSVLAVWFSVWNGTVDTCKNFWWRNSIVRIGGYTKTCCWRDNIRTDLYWFWKNVLDLFNEVKDVCFWVVALNDKSVFVSSDSSEECWIVTEALELFSVSCKENVTCWTAVCVVDDLEVVKVTENNCERHICVVYDRFIHFFDEKMSVRKACKNIVVSKVWELFILVLDDAVCFHELFVALWKFFWFLAYFVWEYEYDRTENNSWERHYNTRYRAERLGF